MLSGLSFLYAEHTARDEMLSLSKRLEIEIANRTIRAHAFLETASGISAISEKQSLVENALDYLNGVRYIGHEFRGSTLSFLLLEIEVQTGSYGTYKDSLQLAQEINLLEPRLQLSDDAQARSQFLALWCKFINTKPWSDYTPIESRRPLSACVVSTNPRRCIDAVQGKIAWNSAGETKWRAENVQELCGLDDSIEPAQCFQRVLSIGKNYSSTWSWEETIALCARTRDAVSTIACFQGEYGRSGVYLEAISRCAK